VRLQHGQILGLDGHVRGGVVARREAATRGARRRRRARGAAGALVRAPGGSGDGGSGDGTVLDDAPKTASSTRRRDLAPFYLGCKPSTHYVVSKAILNTYNVALAARVFGETRASFVFAVRHPFGGCPGKGFRDPRQCARAAERLKWWLAAHETLFKDLDAFARRAAVIQLERLVADPVETLGALADVLAIEDHETLAFRFKRGGEVLQTATRRRLGIWRDTADARRDLADGLVAVAEPARATQRAEAQFQSWARRPGSPWSPRLQNRSRHSTTRLGKFCYEAATILPVRRGACKAPLLKRIRHAPARVDLAGPMCPWAPLEGCRHLADAPDVVGGCRCPAGAAASECREGNVVWTKGR